MRGHSAYLLSALLCTCDGGAGLASEFWFAASDVSGAPGPAPLTECVCGEIGSQFDIHIWVQPDSFATLRNFSLDLTSNNSAALDFTAVEINNSGSNHDRFQYVFDSTPTAGLTPVDIETAPDRVLGIQGFTILTTGGATYQGLNTTARLVTVTFELANSATTTLQLATGSNGINNDGQSTSAHVAGFSDIVLTVHDVPADFNRDNVVNQADLEIWAANFYTPYGADCTIGDADFDGDVDGLDFLLFQRNYGRMGTPITATVPLPEPHAILCFVFGLLSLSGTLLRKRGQWGPKGASWIVAVGICLGLCMQNARAQQFANWNVAAGSWSNEANWSPQIVPSVSLEFDSARIDNGGLAIIDSAVDTIRDLDVGNGELRVQSDFDLNLVGSAVVDSQGLLRVESDSSVVFNAPDEVLLLSGGKLAGSGVLAFDLGALDNHGEVSPGGEDTLGSLTIFGDYNQFTDGTLRLDLRGSQIEQLVVNGTAKLAGNLIVDFGNMNAGVDTFVPFFDGDVTIDGRFDQVMFLSAPIGEICQGYNLDFPGTKGFWAGDMNLDGLVTAEDVQLFALALVNPGAYEDNRASIPSIDGYRYDVLASHMGNVDLVGTFNFDDIEAFAMKTNMPVSAVLDAVEAALREIPEPTSTTLLLTTIALLICLRTPSCRRCCW